MIQDNPKNSACLSVLIPNYNHGEYLEACIRSHLACEIKLEFIIVDDASKDNSVQIIKRLICEGINITLIQLNENIGVVRAMNLAFEKASGDYVLFRAADDLTVGNCLDDCIYLLEENPQSGLVCGDLGYFYRENQDYTVERLFDDTDAGYCSPDLLVDKSGPNPIFSHTVIFRTSALRSTVGFEEKHQYYCDWFVTYLVAFTYGICYLPKCVALARLSATSYSNDGSKDVTLRNTVINELVLSINHLNPEVRERFDRSNVLGFFISEKDSVSQIDKGSTSSEAFSHTGMIGVIRTKLGNIARFLEKLPKKSRVYWYGAGYHSELLLKVWTELEIEQPCAIWISGEATQDLHWKGIPVLQFPMLLDDEPSFIVISSKSYEPAMMASVITEYDHLPILSFWGCGDKNLKG